MLLIFRRSNGAATKIHRLLDRFRDKGPAKTQSLDTMALYGSRSHSRINVKKRRTSYALYASDSLFIWDNSEKVIRNPSIPNTNFQFT